MTNSEKVLHVAVSSDFIKLDSFLKLANLVGSGGEAKILIAEGEVLVNDQVELRRGRKLFPGDCVSYGGHQAQVVAQG